MSVGEANKAIAQMAVGQGRRETNGEASCVRYEIQRDGFETEERWLVKARQVVQQEGAYRLR